MCKIQKLGFEPEITIKEGLKNTIKWYKENKSEMISSKEKIIT